MLPGFHLFWSGLTNKRKYTCMANNLTKRKTDVTFYIYWLGNDRRIISGKIQNLALSNLYSGYTDRYLQ